MKRAALFQSRSFLSLNLNIVIFQRNGIRIAGSVADEKLVIQNAEAFIINFEAGFCDAIIYVRGGDAAGEEGEGGIFDGDIFKHSAFDRVNDETCLTGNCIKVTKGDIGNLFDCRVINISAPCRSHPQSLNAVEGDIFKRDVVDFCTVAHAVTRTNTDTDIGVDDFQIGKFTVSDRTGSDTDTHSAGGRTQNAVVNSDIGTFGIFIQPAVGAADGDCIIAAEDGTVGDFYVAAAVDIQTV